MVHFAYASMLWGLLLVGAPVLIHLINMLRHRRVPWAAMEFLLVGQKKHRTRIFLKQLLLLLLRTAVIAAVVLAAAKPTLHRSIGRWFNGGASHHVVLLDDSFSMDDRGEDGAVFDRAKDTVRRIGEDVAREGAREFTLLRFSQVGRGTRGTRPDFLRETIDPNFAEKLGEKLATIRVSQTAAGPQAALEAIDALLGKSDERNRVVHIVSDFRARDWEKPDALREHLRRWTDDEVKIHFVHCVETARPNLAVTRLLPSPGTRAAGVQFFMEATVFNYGDREVSDVPLRWTLDGRPQPAIRIASIPPRRATVERFPVLFTAAGEHRVTVALEPDAVADDNERREVVDVPAGLPVLLIDGDPEAKDAKYLGSVFAPGGPQTTGIRPRVETPRYLNTQPLDSFCAVYLLNVDRLDASAVAALERYVKSGGGLGFFAGERSRAEFINRELYRDGTGCFPIPVAGPVDLAADYLAKAPDLRVASHPIFQVFAGERNGFLPTVKVNRYLGVAKDGPAKTSPDVRVIAELRNGAPLAVERRFGRGRVVAFLTTAAPKWNNWARENPSFVVAMLELQAYLAAQPMTDASQLVGAPLEIRLDPTRYEPLLRIVGPAESVSPTASLEAVAGPDGKLGAAFLNTDLAGYYQVRPTPKTGKEETRLFAYNVSGEEGDLRLPSGEALAAGLEGVRYTSHRAAAYQYAADAAEGRNLTEYLIYLLVALLLAEQWLARSASYHPAVARHPAIVEGGVR